MKQINSLYAVFSILLFQSFYVDCQASVISHPFFNVSGVVIVWGANDWQENGGSSPIVSDFVLMNSGSGNAGNDIILGDTYAMLKGSLLPVPKNSDPAAGNELYISRKAPSGSEWFSDNNSNGLLDINDSFNAFQLRDITDLVMRRNTMNHHFYVASNIAFDIYAQVDNLQASDDFSILGLENIRWQMKVKVKGSDGLSFGSKAQNPSAGGSGIVGSNNRLDTMVAPTKVFDGGRRTAREKGSIAQHSVRFTSNYELRRTGTTTDGYDLSMGKGHIEMDITYTIYTP